MKQPSPSRPLPGDFSEFYAGYVSKVPDDNIVRTIRLSTFDAIVFLENIPADKWDYRYADGKWTIREALLHVIDTERVMAYRALRIARADQTPLPGFDQDSFIPNSGAADRSPESLIAEFKAVRESTVELLKNFSPEMWQRRGTASGYPVTVLALAFIIAGHWLHHRRVLEERYLG